MHCILVSGIPAAGKSTIARLLSHKLGIPVISKDDIKEILFDHIGFTSREEKVRLGTASMDVMYYAASQMLKTNTPFILENNFENASRDGLNRLLADSDCPVLTITLTGDYETIYRRFVERNISPDRHRGHVVNDCYPEKVHRTNEELLANTISLEQYIEGIRLRGFDAFVGSKDQIIVDTTDFTKVDIDELFRRIDVWLKEALRAPSNKKKEVSE